MKKGDLIWQSRKPGGFCIFLEEIFDETMGEALYRVYHPLEGCLMEATYYYCTVEELKRREERRRKYENKKRDSVKNRP